MASKTTPTAAETASANKTGTKIPTAMIPKDLYADIVRLSAFNKIKKSGPQSDSAILREAITSLMEHVGFDPQKTDILAIPKDSYAKKLAAVHQDTQDAQLVGGVRKTFSIASEGYDAAEAFASYNKLHGLKPKNVSQLCRDALTFYIDAVPYKFRPE